MFWMILSWLVTVVLPVMFYIALRMVPPGRLNSLSAVGCVLPVVVVEAFYFVHTLPRTWLPIAVNTLLWAVVLWLSRDRIRLHYNIIGLETDGLPLTITPEQIRDLAACFIRAYPRIRFRVELKPSSPGALELSVDKHPFAQVTSVSDDILERLIQLQPLKQRGQSVYSPAFVYYVLGLDGKIYLHSGGRKL